MMKKTILASVIPAICALWPVVASAQISESALDHHRGFVRKGHCANGAGEHCGSNPPTWHLTPAECGTLQSTSNARNEDGSVSTMGVRYTFPTLAELLAYGYTPGGLTDLDNREGQCEFSFVMGLPLPENYLRLAIEGVQNSDRFTFQESGAFRDMFNGDVIFPGSSGTITTGWGGVSWLAKAGTPNLLERVHMGQQQRNATGRLFPVTLDPPWWTVPTRVGTLAYCPHDGRATSSEDNGYTNLHIFSFNCVFKEAGVGTSNEWINLRYLGSNAVTAIAAGNAYVGGTAPNGVAYPGGNYPVLTLASSVGLVSGTTVQVDDITTTLGGRYLQGKWIGEVLTAGATGCPAGTCVALHENVNDANSQAVSTIGPPGAFIAGDTMTAGVVNPISVSYYSLTGSSGGTLPVTNPNNGMEIEGTSRSYTNLGFAHKAGGVYIDTPTSRTVVSRFNAEEKECRSVTAADRTTTSLTFVELNSDARCTFLALNRSSAQSKLRGDTGGGGVRYSLTMTFSNSLAADGCEAGVAFDGTTPEPTLARHVNGASVQGPTSVTVQGIKFGLPETTTHYATPVWHAINGGTCTGAAAATSMSVFIKQ
jgi:hypothetical protein